MTWATASPAMTNLGVSDLHCGRGHGTSLLVLDHAHHDHPACCWPWPPHLLPADAGRNHRGRTGRLLNSWSPSSDYPGRRRAARPFRCGRRSTGV